MKQISFKSSVNYLNKLRGVFYIMVGIPLTIFLVLYLLFRQNTYTSIYPNMPEFLINILAVIFIIAGITSFIFYFKKLPFAQKASTLRAKLEQYYQICYYKFSMLLVISILNLFCYFLTAHTFFAGVYILHLIMFALNNPSYYNVVGNLKLKKEEREILKNNSIIN